MPEVQARRLIEMMRHTVPSSRVEVCLHPQVMKRSVAKSLSEGDILALPIKKMKVILLDDTGNVMAQGLYGLLDNTPSVLIEESKKSIKESINSKKYKSLKISLGEISGESLEPGKIISLRRDDKYEAALYRDKKLFAYADLVQIDGCIALQIQKVK